MPDKPTPKAGKTDKTPQTGRKPISQRSRQSATTATSQRIILTEGQRWPIYECLIGLGWQNPTQSGGLVMAVITRAQPNKRFAVANFLVDMLGLGIKHAYLKTNLLPDTYVATERAYLTNQMSLTTCEPALIHQIVYQAIDFAAEHHMRPHVDYAQASQLLSPRGTYPETYPITFGKDGKPLIISRAPGADMDVPTILTDFLGPDRTKA